MFIFILFIIKIITYKMKSKNISTNIKGQMQSNNKGNKNQKANINMNLNNNKAKKKSPSPNNRYNNNNIKNNNQVNANKSNKNNKMNQINNMNQIKSYNYSPNKNVQNIQYNNNNNKINNKNNYNNNSPNKNQSKSLNRINNIKNISPPKNLPKLKDYQFIEFHPYSLKDYKELMRNPVVMGPLGPNIGTKEWEEKKKKMKKMMNYSNNVNKEHKGIKTLKKDTPKDEIEKRIKENIEKNRELYERLLSFVLEAVPGVHTAVYYHCFLDTWPESKELFKEDAIINSYGAHQHYLDPKPDVKSVYMLYLPTLQNEFGKACSKMIDEIMQFHCPQNAAFYWDEFKSSKIGYTYNPNVWDGCSGEIDDKTFELKRRMTSVAYASRDFRLAMVRKIKATGREVVVNGIPITRDIMKENLIAFTETAQISNCLKNHIYTPVQLGNHKLSSEDAARSEVIYHQMLEGLDYGMLYYYYQIQYLPDHHTLTQYMFPLTPMELHCGYIIGKEKIVTKLSGLYGWNDASALTAFVYDDKGWPVPDFKAPTKLENGRSFIELRLPEDWSAIILRK